MPLYERRTDCFVVRGVLRYFRASIVRLSSRLDCLSCTVCLPLNCSGPERLFVPLGWRCIGGGPIGGTEVVRVPCVQGGKIPLSNVIGAAGACVG